MNSEVPLISVIVPVYNVEPYLKTCIDSILKQTYRNLEIILVASTSIDNSVVICDSYLQVDSRLQVLHTEPQGLSAARNIGVSMASGTYLCFVDSDDFISQNFVETLYGLSQKYDADIVQCNFLEISENATYSICESCTSIFNDALEIHIYSNVDMCANLYNDLADSSTASWTKLYRKELFMNVKYPIGKIHEDEGTSYKLFYLAKRVAVTSLKLYYYRSNPLSLTRATYTLKKQDSLQFSEEQMDFFREGGYDKLYALALKKYMISLSEHILLTKVYLSKKERNDTELEIKYKAIYKIAAKNLYLPIYDKWKITLIHTLAKLGSMTPQLTQHILFLRRLCLQIKIK
ncbi:glycosyl transferase, family 2 [Methanocorpusculum labreanum Z]|uniref:Glycosyl transferase, family 2 n=1 Tax=Methanocorpusculum labreanum (strain ATCC 43576 / DSM 4855 / Z) TaxID=410358 RepID=A2STD8_METLZ|nr:glycosyltransferase [Methanocorpusculum labreanum]ABN07594.1 glycosyl transferase, family 2 [Methanocorpusculum labreanum Z]